MTQSPAAWKALGRRTPTEVGSSGYFDHLVRTTTGSLVTESSRCLLSGVPTDPAAANSVPDAFDPIQSKSHRADDVHHRPRAEGWTRPTAPIAKRFHETSSANSKNAFAKAWYKLTHRDMGPGLAIAWVPNVPEPRVVAGPRSGGPDHELIGERGDRASSRRRSSDSGLSNSDLVSTAWASASTFRGTDKRGGANGARIRLAPQKDWEVNEPEARLGQGPCRQLETRSSRSSTESRAGGKNVVVG